MRQFGEIEGVYPGQIFANRAELAKSGIHPPNQAGISGSIIEGADSIVLSGGYEDDQDYGDRILYTGAGGRDEKTKQQIADQELTGKNLALAKSKLYQLPVRVTRSHKHKSEYSPDEGYCYAGLYIVEDYWCERGISGHYIWRYSLVSCELAGLDKQNDTKELDKPPGYKETERKVVLVKRIVRDTTKARRVKEWHGYKCQVCGMALETSAGLYAEAAHIQPLGMPHSGPDDESNILCLCPNHHVLFDNGGFTINEDMSLNGIDGHLITNRKHKIDIRFITYHQEHYQQLK
ncbi:YDG/SRA domain-containing protein [Photobacterium alginatilyticum]|uniref:HNH endonuclease n=1 Tax=Photobacterium alginatilyticum TaxID=1775171 RepID=A0ABW9YHJ5_9GAMM|nr:YDG/SRA domain-containing protein [Photobacterium alginatilyticum]NBI53251.1 HNH endonuclease [Photobacterium alginatilyticum]